MPTGSSSFLDLLKKRLKTQEAALEQTRRELGEYEALVRHASGQADLVDKAAPRK